MEFLLEMQKFFGDFKLNLTGGYAFFGIFSMIFTFAYFIFKLVEGKINKIKEKNKKDVV